MQNYPGQEVDKNSTTGEERHDYGHIQPSDGEDDEVMCEDPHHTEEGALPQKLQWSHSLGH